MPRKKTPESSKRGRVEFVADPEWIEKLMRHAEALGVNVSAFIRMAVNRQMNAEPMPPTKTQKK